MFPLIRRSIEGGIAATRCITMRRTTLHSAMVLFGIAAAFPSVEWEWIWLCLDAMGVSGRLSSGLRRTYDPTRMTFLFSREMSHDAVNVCRRGIKQGCPASGALPALLLVRRLVVAPPPHG